MAARGYPSENIESGTGKDVAGFFASMRLFTGAPEVDAGGRAAREQAAAANTSPCNETNIQQQTGQTQQEKPTKPPTTPFIWVKISLFPNKKTIYESGS